MRGYVHLSRQSAAHSLCNIQIKGSELSLHYITYCNQRKKGSFLTEYLQWGIECKIQFEYHQHMFSKMNVLILQSILKRCVKCKRQCFKSGYCILLLQSLVAYALLEVGIFLKFKVTAVIASETGKTDFLIVGHSCVMNSTQTQESCPLCLRSLLSLQVLKDHCPVS